MSFVNKIRTLFSGKKNQVQQPKQHRSNSPKSTFSIDALTDAEKQFCKEAGLSSEDGLLLKRLTRRPIEKLKFEQEYSVKEKPDAICSLTSEENARRIVLENQIMFAKEGKYIFISEISYNGNKVGLIGTADPYQLMEYAEVNGANYEIETKDIIEKYKKWDKEFGIKLVGVGFDFCEAEIINKNIDYKKLAEEVYEFCPDVVEQGTQTVEALEQEIKRTGTIYLWWD